jgi:hypothetical protein
LLVGTRVGSVREGLAPGTFPFFVAFSSTLLVFALLAFPSALGVLADALAGFSGALEVLADALAGFSGALGVLAGALEVFSGALEVLAGALEGFSGALEVFSGALEVLAGALEFLANALADFSGALAGLSGALAGLEPLAGGAGEGAGRVALPFSLGGPAFLPEGLEGGAGGAFEGALGFAELRSGRAAMEFLEESEGRVSGAPGDNPARMGSLVKPVGSHPAHTIETAPPRSNSISITDQ